MPSRLTPLFGTANQAAYEPHSALLEIDEARILLDCGCFENGSKDGPASESVVALQEAYLDTLTELAPSLTMILLSAPLPSFLGLLPFLVNQTKLNPTCAIYASPPTLALGSLALKEWAAALCTEQDPGFSSAAIRNTPEAQAKAAARAPWKFSPAQLQKALARVSNLRFSSPVLLTGRNAPLTLVANRAGFTLGATVWTIRTPTNEEISYAPAWHHVRERTLDGATMTNITVKGKQKSTIIIDAARSKYRAPKLAARKQALLDTITSTLHSSHSVLLPTDASARVVELLVLLDQHWTYSRLQAYPLCFVSRTADELKLALKNVYEFFGTNMQAQVKPGLEPSFVLDNFRFFPTVNDLDAAFPNNGPKCVVSVPSTLSYGYSRSLFPQFAAQSGNLVILTQPVEPGSLSEMVWQNWENGQDGTELGNAAGKVGDAVELGGAKVTLKMHEKVNLEGEELAAFEEKKKQEATEKAKEKALQDRTRQLAEAADEDEDDSSSDESEAEDLPKAKRLAAEDAETGASLPGFSSYGYVDEFVDQAPSSAMGGFDIYIKGQLQKRTEFTLAVQQEDGTSYVPNLRELPRVRLFPFVERRRKVDAYGEIIDVAGWLSRGKAEEAARSAAAETSLGKRKRDEPVKERSEAPHKYVTMKVEVVLNCSAFVVDLSGKADGPATKQLLPHLNPRKLVLVGGTQEAREDLKQVCLTAEGMTRDIFATEDNQVATIGDDIDSLSLRLDDDLVSTLKMRRVEDYEIVKLNGHISIPDVSSIPVLAHKEAARIDGASHLATLVELFNASKAEKKTGRLAPLAPSLFIGDVRLALLKNRLIALGIPSSFAGEGILVCGPVPSAKQKAASSRDPKTRLTSKSRSSSTPEPGDDHSGGKVAVRKTADGSLMLQGQPGETFQLVRQTVYSSLAGIS